MPKKNQHQKKSNHRSGKETNKTEKVLDDNVDHSDSKVDDNQNFSHLNKENNQVSDVQRKYAKREIVSNWSKYDSELVKVETNTFEEIPKATDFEFLLNSSTTDCSYFQYRSDNIIWEKERKEISNLNSNIFNLNLQVLTLGLACLPLYEVLEIDKDNLSDKDIKRCDSSAARNWKEYKALKEVSDKKLSMTLPQTTLQQPLTAKTAFENQHLKINVNLPVKTETSVGPSEAFYCPDLDDTTNGFKSSSNKIHENDNIRISPTSPEKHSDGKIQPSGNISSLGVELNSEKEAQKAASLGEEDLEDWLDSVLDD